MISCQQNRERARNQQLHSNWVRKCAPQCVTLCLCIEHVRSNAIINWIDLIMLILVPCHVQITLFFVHSALSIFRFVFNLCLRLFPMIGPLSIGGGYQDDVDSCASDDDENAIIDVEDYKIPAITVNSAIPSTQTSGSGGGGGLSQSHHHHHSGSNNNNNNNNSSSNNHNNNGNGSSSSLTKNRIGRPTKSSLSSPVSSTASDDERLSPDSVKVRIILHTYTHKNTRERDTFTCCRWCTNRRLVLLSIFTLEKELFSYDVE